MPRPLKQFLAHHLCRNYFITVTRCALKHNEKWHTLYAIQQPGILSMGLFTVPEFQRSFSYC